MSSTVAYNYQKITHVIFDCDGVLVGNAISLLIKSLADTEKIYDRVNAKLIHPLSPLYPSTELTPAYKTKIMGLPGITVAELIVEDFQLPWSADEYHRIAHEEVMKEFEECELMPGVERLVKHLHRHDIPIAVHKAQHSHIIAA